MNIRCKIFGHKREHYIDGQYWSRRCRRMHDHWATRCSRCGAGDPACYKYGIIERVRSDWGVFKHRVWPPAPPRKGDDNNELPF